MKRTRANQRNRMLETYHTQLKRIPFGTFKHDYQMLHVLWDQYHRALKLLHEEKSKEDLAIAMFTGSPQGQKEGV